MKKSTKLIAILTVVAVLTALVALAVADDKIYTSPTFKLPKSRIVMTTEPEEPVAEETIEPAAEGEATEPAAEETTEPAAEGEATEPATEGEATEPAAEGEATEPAAEGEATEPATEGEATEPAAEGEATEPAAEGEATEPAAEGEATEPAAEGEATEPAEEPAAEPAAEPQSESQPEAKPETKPEPVERKVMIYSTRKDVVTEGDIIELTGALIGFDDVPDEAISYQWQVDRNDGNGWANVDGANKWYYKFIANKQTILYNWRLIVTVSE